MKDEIVKSEQVQITDLQNPGTALATITKAEIDIQISTAHAYPRSLTAYQSKAMAMLTMNQEIASECFYVIPRGGKTIEGPSVRLAEIVAASYGNMRSGARVVAEEMEFVVAQGICHDLESNFAVTFEVKRRIMTKDGRRYDSDMIGVTGNAASSIAFRNTVFRVVPKVLWLSLYQEARRVAKGDAKTFEVRREAVLIGFEKLKVKRQVIFDFLGVEGLQDMNSEHLLTLIGIGNAIKAGEAKIEDLYNSDMNKEPDGDIKLEKDSPLKKNPEVKTAADGSVPAEEKETITTTAAPQFATPNFHDIFFHVGKSVTTIKGDVRKIVANLPKLGAMLDKENKVWEMPASRTHELTMLMDTKSMTYAEVDQEGNVMTSDPENQTPRPDGESQHSIWPKKG